jgi:mRNA-degrading endonuclease toxin of MazEF toxin-antitoxin module
LAALAVDGSNDARASTESRHRPAPIIGYAGILDAKPTVIQVVTLTTTIRRFTSEITVEPDDASGLRQRSAARCQHVRAASTGRVEKVHGNVGSTALIQIRAPSV